ncbi:MAG TPA: carboxypeptidase regulatory-like domain-containing protein [Rhodanobacteraceae bacterium]|nr:carboxypeptidase regulatory-like domain-containing protein [Rhodanobacteraceae bacterium]
MKKHIRLALLPFAVSSVLAMGAAMAQNVTSSAITGLVVNASGQPVAGATVTIEHLPSGTTKVVQTNASGHYNAQGMRVGGPYEVTVTKAGVAEAERENVYLQLGQTSAINLTLTPVAANAQNLGGVTVTANALNRIFSPENKGISTNISQRELNAIPTPGRNIQNIVRMDPRVAIVGRSEGKISALGQNYRYNNITVDSVSANDPFGLNANGLPTTGTAISQDTIAEYNISTANYDVANRRGLGVNVNAVTKSGTNEFHGSLYYVYQNADMVGDNIDDKPFTAYDKNWTGGFTLGGPIIHDKLFFFLSYEKSEQVGKGSSWGPEGSDAAQTIVGLTQEDVQKVRDIAAGYGLNDLGTSAGGDAGLTDERYLAKLDWNISTNHRASFTWKRTKENQPRIYGGDSSLVLSSGWVVTNTDNKSYALHLYDDWSDNFSSTTSLSFAHFNRMGGPYNGVPMPGMTVHTENFRSPTVEFGTNYSYQANEIDTKTAYASWVGTLYAGDHTFKFGFDYERDEKYNLFLQDYFGSYEFDSIEDFANADFSTYYYHRPADGLSLDDVAAAFTLKQWGFFAQDTWQATDNLSVQYGVRVDMPKTDDKPLYNPAFAAAGFRTSTGELLTTNQYNVDGDKIVQPRFSFNYNFDTERMMQLRGGVGLFITNPPAVWIGNIYSNAGVNTVEFVCQTFRGCNPPPFSADPYNQHDGVAGSGQMTVNTVDPDFTLPSAWKFTLGYDAQLPWLGLVGTIDYEHIKVRNAIWYQDLNLGAPTGTLPDGRNTYYRLPNGDPRASGQQERANANYDFSEAIINLANTSKGYGDSLTLQLKKPFDNDWSAMVGVTFGHATDVNPGLSSVALSSYKQAYVTNPNENVASTSNYNIAARAIASLQWRHAFFGNYYTRFSAFYDGHVGHPYSWSFGNDANGDSFTNDLVYIPNEGDVEFREGTDPQMIQEFYDYIHGSDYLSSHQGEIARRNGDRAPWFNQLDVSISQEVPGIFDGNKGEIRLDIYNFLNLLDKHWGVENRASFPGRRNLADYYGVDPDTGKYIYDITGYPYNQNGHYQPEVVPYYVDYMFGDRAQRWGVQLTLRYKF